MWSLQDVVGSRRRPAALSYPAARPVERGVETRDQMESGALTAARGPDKGDELPAKALETQPGEERALAPRGFGSPKHSRSTRGPPGRGLALGCRPQRSGAAP